ncbi:hypothetical protein AB0D33_34565 [Streptomyces sp. NPDC048404]|uniref:hypothetical protein n=1 Tax=unclassified Streptomyces TaxID=2593676 RepID=UPI00341CA564
MGFEAQGDRRPADVACAPFLESIQHSLPDAGTIPSWDAGQTNAQPVVLLFDRTAELAPQTWALNGPAPFW